MRHAVAWAQAGSEAVRWIRDDAEMNGTVHDMLRYGHLSEAALLAMRGISRRLPAFDTKAMIARQIEDDFDVIAIGAEAIVTREPHGISKYLTGKSRKPDALAPQLAKMMEQTRDHLGDTLAATEVDVVNVKLFKHLPATDYVRLNQPYYKIEHTDPHLDPLLLEQKPEISRALGGMAHQLAELFVETGLLVDIVNQGNIAWGSTEQDPTDRLVLLDTIPVDISSNDFTGVTVPFWRPEMHLEYLADFVNAHDPFAITEG